MASEHWKKAPDAHDFPAAQEFLSLVITPKSAKSLAKALQGADTEVRKAKDLLRASGLPLLRPDNAHVAEDLDKVKKGDVPAKIDPTPFQATLAQAQARAPLACASRPWRSSQGMATDRGRRLPPDLRQLLLGRERRHSLPGGRPRDLRR